MLMSNDDTEGFDLPSLFNYYFEHAAEERANKWNSESLLMRGINRHSKTILMKIIRDLGIDGDYGITARSGSSGKWAKTPYICIIMGKPNGFYKQYSAEKGVYPAYLFSDTCSEIYLSFMIAVGSKTKRELNHYIEIIRQDVGETSFSYDTDSMTIGDDAHLYREATVFFRCYKKGEPLSVEMLINDLSKMIHIQRKLGLDYYRNLVVIK